MLRLSMFCLVSSMSCGVFGFGTGAAPSGMLAQAMFALLFAMGIAALLVGTCSGGCLQLIPIERADER